VRGDPDHPANFGRLCTKGSTLHLTATASPSRARRACCSPMRRAQRGEAPQRIGWDAALDQAADRKFAQVVATTAPTRWASTSAASC
jgi:assimilatory nitrate reductase catalytic subunit